MEEAAAAARYLTTREARMFHTSPKADFWPVTSIPRRPLLYVIIMPMAQSSKTPKLQNDGKIVRASVGQLHVSHPKIRAADWRSPLIVRLLLTDSYHEGSRILESSIKSQVGSESRHPLVLHWRRFQTDFEKCIKTYQGPVITELATLGLACVMVHVFGNLEITEVTRRGEKADYWIGKKEYLLEVSGRLGGSLEKLCEAKASQLLSNPFCSVGYVCVAIYRSSEARLWFYGQTGSKRA